MDIQRIEFQKRLKQLYSVYPAATELNELRIIEFGRQISGLHILEIKIPNVWSGMNIFHYYQRPVNEKILIEEFEINGFKTDTVFINKTDQLRRSYHKQHIFYKKFPKNILDELYCKIDLIRVELI